jgi:hypothetical protein
MVLDRFESRNNPNEKLISFEIEPLSQSPFESSQAVESAQIESQRNDLQLVVRRDSEYLGNIFSLQFADYHDFCRNECQKTFEAYEDLLLDPAEMTPKHIPMIGVNYDRYSRKPGSQPAHGSGFCLMGVNNMGLGPLEYSTELEDKW